MAASASKQMTADLALQAKQLQKANDKLRLAESKCAALETELKAAKSSKKRARDDAATTPSPETSSDKNPEKRSPPTAEPSGASFLNLSAVSNMAVCGDESSDGAEPPEPTPESPTESAAAAPDLLYEGLNSVLCAYKAGKLKPNENGLTYSLCAALCRDEREASKRWSRKDKAKFKPMIMSALRLIFPKTKNWESKQFLQSPGGAASYWRTVLARRCQVWTDAAKREKLIKEAYLTPLKQRIRAKIEMRKMRAGRSSSMSSTPTTTPHSGTKDSPISVQLSSSDDSSDAEVSRPSTDVKTTPKAKMAPGPETYTKAEMKNFERIANSIQQVDDGTVASHSAATADFIDVEFGGNLGRAKRAFQTKSGWRKERFKQACTQAARIMQER